MNFFLKKKFFFDRHTHYIFFFKKRKDFCQDLSCSFLKMIAKIFSEIFFQKYFEEIKKTYRERNFYVRTSTGVPTFAQS
ncbi:TPA: hypothetical protein DD617_03845 [Candidatus Uhrbacteria bacterium]|nr:hypothetical protein [Candidatus Uhrbacteria bacterium]